VEDRGFTFSKQTNCVYEDDNDEPETKLSWGVKAPESFLNSVHMRAYRALLDESVDANSPLHSSAHCVFPAVASPRKRRCGYQPPVGKRPRNTFQGPTKKARVSSSRGEGVEGESDTGSDSDDSSSSGDDSDTEEIVEEGSAPRRHVPGVDPVMFSRAKYIEALAGDGVVDSGL
jgi:hypothetical protein